MWKQKNENHKTSFLRFQRKHFHWTFSTKSEGKPRNVYSVSNYITEKIPKIRPNFWSVTWLCSTTMQQSTKRFSSAKNKHRKSKSLSTGLFNKNLKVRSIWNILPIQEVPKIAKICLSTFTNKCRWFLEVWKPSLEQCVV